MTSVRDEGLWITDGRNGGPDGQTNQGAAAAGAAAGLAEGVSRLFGGKTPQQKYSDLVRHSEEIYARETKAYNERREEKVFRDKLPKDERLYHFRDNAKYVTWGQLPQKVKDRGRRALTMSERVYPDALRDFCAVSNSDYQSPSENRRMQDMHKHLLPLLSDSNWRRADGNLAEGGHLEPGEVDLGFGGDYACNEVWDGSLPY